MGQLWELKKKNELKSYLPNPRFVPFGANTAQFGCQIWYPWLLIVQHHCNNWWLPCEDEHIEGCSFMFIVNNPGKTSNMLTICCCQWDDVHQLTSIWHIFSFVRHTCLCQLKIKETGFAIDIDTFYLLLNRWKVSIWRRSPICTNLMDVNIASDSAKDNQLNSRNWLYFFN